MGENFSCSHQFSEEEEIRSCVRFLTEWECDYCGKIINWGGNHPRPNQTMTSAVLNSLAEKHLQECEKAKSFIVLIDAKKKNDNSVYDNENSLKEKGYWDFNKIKNWELINRVNLPDLKEKKRIGIVKELTAIGSKFSKDNSQNYKENFTGGNCIDGLVFLTSRLSPINLANFKQLLKKIDKPDSFYFPCGKSQKTNFYDKQIVAFFIWKVIQKGEDWNHNVFSSMVNLHKFMPISGESGTLPFYLELLSAYHQKPISQEVAATGFLDIGNYSELNCCPWCLQEKIIKNPSQNFTKNKIFSVGGLEYKIPAAVQAGVKKLILSTEQKKDYEKNVPQEIRKKLQVYYVKDVEELEELFWKDEFS